MKNNKKLIAIICGVVVVVAAAVVTTVIIINNNNNNNSNNSSNENRATTTNSGSTASNSTNAASSLVGKWKYYDADLGSMDFIYTFNANGTGQYDLSGSVMNFTYKVDGNKISIIYDTGPFETEFEIKGDTLNIKDSAGNDTLYKKVN